MLRGQDRISRLTSRIMDGLAEEKMHANGPAGQGAHGVKKLFSGKIELSIRVRNGTSIFLDGDARISLQSSRSHLAPTHTSPKRVHVRSWHWQAFRFWHLHAAHLTSAHAHPSHLLCHLALLIASSTVFVLRTLQPIYRHDNLTATTKGWLPAQICAGDLNMIVLRLLEDRGSGGSPP